MPKLHIDTDLGGDIDDLCALAMALSWPEVELLAVTTVAEHQGKRAGYVRFVLDLVGRGDIPVGSGAEVSQGSYRSEQSLLPEEIYWPVPVPPAPGSLDQALDLLKRSIEQGAAIAAIGPFTNLAWLEKRSPGILRLAKLYLMGGYVFPPAEGLPAWAREDDFNVQVDVQSAYEVIERADPTFVTLAASAQTALRMEYLPGLSQSGPLGQLILRQAEAFGRDENFAARYGQTCRAVPEDILNFQHDALACAIALGWNEGVEIRGFPLKSEIRDGWLFQWIDERGKPARVVTQVDGERFNQFWLDTILHARFNSGEKQWIPADT